MPEIDPRLVARYKELAQWLEDHKAEYKPGCAVSLESTNVMIETCRKKPPE